MIKVDISKGIKVGGFDYTIDMSHEAHRRLRSAARLGECSSINREIRIDPDDSLTEISETFLHECIEAVNDVYCAGKLEHDHICQISFGLHQVMESLGVRFAGEISK